MDLPLYRFDIENADVDRLTGLMGDAQQEMERGNYRRAFDQILRRFPIVGSPVLPEVQFEAAARAMLATVRTTVAFRTLDHSQAERAAASIGNAIPTSVGDWDGLLPHDLLTRHAALERWRQARAADDIHGIIIASVPRSGSTFLSNTISDCLGIPSLRCSFGHFPTMALVPQWTKKIVSGGAVTHDHFAASPFNQDVMFATGVNEIIVQVRDPLDALASLTSMHDQSERDSPPTLFDMPTVLGLIVRWLESWRRAAESADRPKITFVHFDDLKNQPEAVFRRVLGPALWARFGAVVKTALKSYAADTTRIPNHRSKRRDAQTIPLTDAQRRELANAVPKELEAFLQGLRTAGDSI